MTTKRQTAELKMIQDEVQAFADWIDKLGRGEVTEDDYKDVYEELLSSVYDVNYTLGQDRELISVRVMVAGGGPTIWIDSRFGVEGLSWGDVARREISPDARDLLLEVYPFKV